MGNFEDLEVYQRALEISVTIHKTTLQFPKIEQYALAGQMRRASKSICANVVEGFGKQRLMALGSASEMRVWIKYAFTLGYIEQSMFNAWIDEYVVIAKILSALRG